MGTHAAHPVLLAAVNAAPRAVSNLKLEAGRRLAGARAGTRMWDRPYQSHHAVFAGSEHVSV